MFKQNTIQRYDINVLFLITNQVSLAIAFGSNIKTQFLTFLIGIINLLKVNY